MAFQGNIPTASREAIARNIRDRRMNRFPGRGGAKRCAEAFGVSPQQWSPWERGMRTPDEKSLMRLAAFFGVTVEWLCLDHTHSEPGGDEENRSLAEQSPGNNQPVPGPSVPELFTCQDQNRVKAV